MCCGPVSQRIPVPASPHLRLVHVPVPKREHQIRRRRTRNGLQYRIKAMYVVLQVSLQRFTIDQIEERPPGSCLFILRIRIICRFARLHLLGNEVGDMLREHT